jgi:protein tyrosine phosphatase (PTP) superfamily phosphohydrolase (DUF442 family)
LAKRGFSSPGAFMKLTAILPLLGLTIYIAGCKTPVPWVPNPVAPGIFEGGLPVTTADFANLRHHGIRTVLSLETMIVHIEPERRAVRKEGLIFRNVPLLPSLVVPRERQIREILSIMTDRELQPVFVHCLTGNDRTTFIAGLYRMYYQEWTPEAAWKEMLRRGFHARWWLRGLEVYFWKHTQRPEWVERVQTPVTTVPTVPDKAGT